MNRVRLSAFAAALLLAHPATHVAQTTVSDATSSHVINLMPLIDPTRDAVDGKWTMQDGKLVSELGGRSRLMIPYEPPDEYDYRIVLTRRQGNGYALQFLPHNEHTALWIMGTKDDTLYGFELIGGKGIYAANNPTAKHTTLGFASGRSFTSLVKVRKNGLTAFMDGKQITEWKTDFTDVSIGSYWELPNRQLLGIGCSKASFVFEKIEIVEVTGKGKPLRESASPSSGQPPPVAANMQAGAQKEAGKFARNQSSIKALYVIETRAGMRAGSAQDIIATVERGGSSRDKVCDFVADVAKDTRISMQEADRLLKLRYPTWEWGCKVRFSYANKYTKQAGGSAGGAFSVLLLSLLDGMQIDPGYAMTGDVTVDGKIREVGAVAEKIRGAVLENCRIIAVPDTNKEDLNDLAVLYSPAMFWSAQIFSIATLDEAAALARVDRATNLASAVSLFAEVQSRLGRNAGAAALRNAWVCQSLREILRLAPNHLSAEFMLRAANNQLAPTLSLRTSLDEIWMAATPLLAGLLSKDPNPKAYHRFAVKKIPDDVIKTMSARLAGLQFRIHPKTRDLKLAITEYVSTIDQLMHQPTTISRSTYEQFLAKKEKVLGEASNLGTDRKVLEEMMH
ncbi:MAG: S16 family serine protease [Verrucomicrobiia bacterium]